MLSVNIQVTYHALSPAVIASQLPFATSQAINSTAFKVRPALVAQTDKAFNIRRPWVKNAWRIHKSTKQQLTAKVYHLMTPDAMMRQEDGGKKDPKRAGAAKGLSFKIHSKKNVATANRSLDQTKNLLSLSKLLAIPIDQSKVLTKAKRAGALSKKRRVFVQYSKQQNNLFLAMRDAGKEAGKKRTKRGKLKKRMKRTFKVIMGLEMKADVKARLRAFPVSRRVIRTVFHSLFKSNLQRAVNSAKRKATP